MPDECKGKVGSKWTCIVLVCLAVCAAVLFAFVYKAVFSAPAGDARQVTIAAADSRPAAKAAADYVCTGTNDELVVQRAIWKLRGLSPGN